MAPGRLGLVLNVAYEYAVDNHPWHAEIEVVEVGTQGHLKGIQVGWKILAVDNLQFSWSLLRSRIFGQQNYELLFATDGRRQTSAVRERGVAGTLCVAA